MKDLNTSWMPGCGKLLYPKRKQTHHLLLNNYCLAMKIKIITGVLWLLSTNYKSLRKCGRWRLPNTLYQVTVNREGEGVTNSDTAHVTLVYDDHRNHLEVHLNKFYNIFVVPFNLTPKVYLHTSSKQNNSDSKSSKVWGFVHLYLLKS